MTPKNEAMVEEWKGYPWYPAIRAAADQLTGLSPKIEFLQIKDKFGGLRFYFEVPDDLGPEDMNKWLQGDATRLRYEADEVVAWAAGWVDGYEQARKRITALEYQIGQLTRSKEEER